MDTPFLRRRPFSRCVHRLPGWWALAAAVAALPVGAQPLFFDSNGTAAGSAAVSSSWTATRWSVFSIGTFATGGWIPGASAVFHAGNTVTAASTTTLSLGEQIRLAALTLNQGNLVVTSGAFGLVLETTTGVTVGTGLTATFDVPVGGTVGLAKSGAGKLILNSGSSTYTSGTTVNAGTLTLGHASALGAGTVSIASGAILDSASHGFDLTRVSGAGTLTGTGTFTYDSAASASLATILDGTASLAKLGTGTLTLTGANTYTGGTTLSAGTLALGSAGALGDSGTITFGGGTLQFGPANTTDYSARFSTAANQGFAFNTNGQFVTFASSLPSSGGTLTKSGTGTLLLTAPATLAGASVLAGELRLGANLGATVDVAAGASVGISSSGAYTTALTGAGSLRIYNVSPTFTGSLAHTGGTVIHGSGLFPAGLGTVDLDAFAPGGNLTLRGGGLTFNASDHVQRTLSLDNGGAGFGGWINIGGNSVTQAGAVTTPLPGFGGLFVSGWGVYTIAGTFNAPGPQDYSIIRAGGTLRLTDGAAVGGNIGLFDFAQLELAFDSTAATASRIIQYNSNASSVRKTGAGEASISYLDITGGVAIEAGTLRFDIADYTFFRGGVSGAGTLRKTGAGVLELNGAFTHSGTLQLDAGQLVLTANTEFTLSNTLRGAGTLVLEFPTSTFNSDASAFTGSLYLSTGTFQIGTATDFGAARIDPRGAVLRWATGSTLDISARLTTINHDNRNGDGANIAIFDTNGNNVTFAHALIAGGRVEKRGAGTLAIAGASSFESQLQITAGSLHLAPAAGETARVLGGVTGTGNFAHTGAGTTIVQSDFAYSLSNLRIDQGTLVMDQSDPVNPRILRSTTGSGTLVKRGSGLLAIAFDAAHTGGTVIEQGELGIGQPFNDSALPPGYTDRIESPERGTITGPVQIAAGARLGLNNWGAVTFTNQISGAGIVGSVRRSVIWGKYTILGDWTHTGGTLTGFAQYRIGDGGTSGSITGDIAVGYWRDPAAYSNPSRVEPGLVFNRSDDITYAGRLSPDEHNGVLSSPFIEKRGAGTLRLTGQSDLLAAYNGLATRFKLSEGTLQVDGAITNVTAHAGTTLAGGGLVRGFVNLQSGATFSPGPGQSLFTVDGDFTSATGSTLRFELGGLARGIGYDALDVSGTINFGGTLIVSLVNGFNPTGGQSFDLLNYSTAIGNFSTVTLPSLTPGLAWDNSALYTTGTLSVTGTAIPEPSTYAAIFGAVALALAIYRRRKK